MTQQARRNNRKTNTPKQQLIGHGLRELILIFFCFIGLYLFISLLTYYPGDPGWGRGEQVEVRNKGGVAGAIFADLFFLWFGYFAYLFPLMVGYVGWLIYKGKHHDIIAEPQALIVPGIGFVLTLVAGCGLAIVHFSAESVLLPSHAGGLLGTWVGHWLVGIVNPLGATLIFVAMFFTGVTLLTGLSWLKLMDTLGYHTLQWLPVLKKYASRHFLPWFMRLLRRWLSLTREFFKTMFRKLRLWGKSAYRRWQERRAEWRREREQYDYDDEDDHDDDYDDGKIDNRDILLKNQEETVFTPIQSFSEPDSLTPSLLPESNEVPSKIAPWPTKNTLFNQTESLLPELSLFNPVVPAKEQPTVEELAEWITRGFQSLNVEIEVNTVHPGPVLTGFEIQTITAINANHLEELNTSLAQVLNVDKVWTVETHPGILNIEAPNVKRQIIYLSELLNHQEYQQGTSQLPLALGQNLNGQVVVVDLTRIPHLLIAGSSPEEKTLAIHTYLLSLLFKATPSTLRLLLIDNVNHELAVYAHLPHLLTPLISVIEEAPRALQWCVNEMERRYRVMASLGIRNLENYNQTMAKLEDSNSTEEQKNSPLFYVVVVIHEIAELVKSPLGVSMEDAITKIAQKGRAAGIHLILATQYPSVNVITGLFKAHISSRIAFQVNSKTESRTILGQMGAENLLGQGDMLYLTTGTGVPVRIHGSYVTEREVQRIVADLKSRAAPAYILTEAEEHEI